MPVVSERYACCGSSNAKILLSLFFRIVTAACIVFVAGLTYRTVLGVNNNLECEIRTPILDTKCSHLVHVVVSVLTALISIISSLQISILKPRVVFATTAVFHLLLLLLYYDTWMVFFVYMQWTVEFIWFLRILQLIPTAAKIFNSVYQLYFLNLGGRCRQDRSVKITSIANIQAVINATMIFHLVCNTVIVVHEYYKTGNNLCFGIVLGLVEFVHRCYAIYIYWKLFRNHERVEVPIKQVMRDAKQELSYKTGDVTDLVMVVPRIIAVGGQSKKEREDNSYAIKSFIDTLSCFCKCCSELVQSTQKISFFDVSHEYVLGLDLLKGNPPTKTTLSSNVVY